MENDSSASNAKNKSDLSDPVDQRSSYCRWTLAIQGLLCISFIGFIIRHDWENVVLTAIVILLTMVPTFISRRFRVYIPPEFQIIAVLFTYFSLYLGSARDFYYRFWWWDMMLHTTSGFLLGIIGWITLFLLNETDRLPPGMKPSFLCFFGVTFAVFLGVLWEIFEFTVDRIWPYANMQSNETGVVDTMRDLIVDTIGAIVVAMMGMAYAKSGKYSFLIDAVRRFTRKNPHLFPPQRPRKRRKRS